MVTQQENSKQDEINFWDVVQTLAAFVAVPVTLLYPVGFFALFAQFVNYYFMDLYTAWYAASFVNRMVAIEQGFTIFALALAAIVILSTWIASVLHAHFERSEPGGSEHSRGFLSGAWAVLTLRRFRSKRALYAKLTFISLVILLLYCVYGRIVAQSWLAWLAIRGRLSTECNPDKVVRHQLELWPDTLIPATLYLVGCLWGGWLIYSRYQNYRRRTAAKANADPNADPNAAANGDTNGDNAANAADGRLGNTILMGVKEGWILSGLATAYLFSVIASIVLALLTPAYMPYMTYGDTVIHQGEPKPTVNMFLSHTNGHWHFLHRIQMEKDNDPKTWTPPVYTIVSLEDSKVKHVRVRPNPPNASRVAPLLQRVAV